LHLKIERLGICELSRILFILTTLAITLGTQTAVGQPQEKSPLEAMKLELTRSFDALKKADPPVYFMAYRLYDKEISEVSADRGSPIIIQPFERNRYASVDVRVGNYDLDSSHRLVNDEHQNAEDTLGAFGVVPFDNAKALRSTFWLETEKEYRVAAQRYGRVQAQQGLKSEEDICADLSRQKPFVHSAASAWSSKEVDLEPFKKAAQSLSKLFAQYPEIEQSWTHFKIDRTTRYLVNSEGTAVEDKSLLIAFSTGASSTATDGEAISRNEVFYFNDEHDMVNLEPRFTKMVRDVASSVEGLRKAPLADPYCGPVILRGPAAAVLFHEVLGHRLEASRHKDSMDGKTFAKMLGERILPPFLSVYDKPLMPTIDGINLNGHYQVDDDGVPAQDVTLIKNGKLVSFLMGRAPIPTCAISNGHGRCGAGSYSPESRMANLIVESSKTAPEDVLRQHLLAEVRKQGKPYGLIIEQVHGGETNTSSYQAQVFQIRPGIVRRVYADGRPDDLIRGVRVIGTPMSVLQRITETTNKIEVFNGYCGAESGWVPQANCCPSVLVDSLEIEREIPDKGIARILPPPPENHENDQAVKESLINAVTK